ncbi:MAG: PAS domain S-box protein, partial [Spongiibacteraceae bacterium]
MKLKIKQNKLFLVAMAFLLLSLIFSVVIARQVKTDNQQAIEAALGAEARRITNAVSDRIEVYQYGLRGARGAVLTAGDNLSRKLFSQYSASREVDKEFPGAHGFGFIRRVPEAEEAKFLRWVRSNDYPDFQLRQIAPHKGERFVIQYIEPLARNHNAIGLDIASESNRRNAAVSAIRSGEVRLTGPITLVQEGNKPLQSTLILMPIYHGVITPPTQAEREQLAYGWSYAPLLMEKVLASVPLDRAEIHLSLQDVTDDGVGVEIFNSAPDAKWIPLSGQVIRHSIYGRQWQFEVSAYPAFVESMNLPVPMSVFAIGALIGVLGTTVLLAVGNSQRLRRKSIYQRELMASMVQSSPNAIITCDSDRRITSWNNAAEDLLGYTRSEAMGATMMDLIVPTHLIEEAQTVYQQMMANDPVPHFETQRRNKAGDLIDVSVTIAPIILKGKVSGYSKTIREITDEVLARQQIIDLNHSLEAQVTRRTEELEHSKRTLQGMLDNVNSFIAYWDADMHAIVMNRLYYDYYGYSAEEACGKHYRELVNQVAYDMTWPSIARVIASGETVADEIFITDADGSDHYILLQVVPEKSAGKVIGIYTLIQEITELREGKERLDSVLRENEALLATINEQMLYSVTDADGYIIDANENFCLSSGYQREELLGKSHRIINSGLHPDAFWQDMWSVVEAGQPWRGEVCNIGKDGSLRWFDSVIAPFVGRNGAVERYVALRTDITDERAAKEERARLNQLLRAVLNASSEVAIIATGRDGVITIFNSGAENMLGYSADEMIGKQAPAIIHVAEEIEARGRELSKQFGEQISGFEVLTYVAKLQHSEVRQWTYIRKCGAELEVSLAVTAMRDVRGDVIGYLGVAVDITEQLHLEQELRRAKELADSSNAAKSEFLANMSHEIRTPMNAVLGMLQLVGRTELSKHQSAYIGKAEMAAKSLLGLLNDILDASKIEVDKLAIESHPFYIDDLMRDLGVVLSGYQSQVPVELMFDIDPVLPRELCGDRLRLQQVLLNLGGNALKFTEQGQVVVRLQQLQRADNIVSMRVSVEDSGIGISHDQAEWIFEGFVQAEASTTRRFGGSGLGLFICKRLVSMMGGELLLESELGKGSRFWFDIELEVLSDEPQAGAAQPACILVVDDNKLVAEVLAGMLDKLGYQVDIAHSASAAVEKVQAAPALGRCYDIVLMDWMLSDLSGIEAAELIAQSGIQPVPPKVLMLTAHAQSFAAAELPFQSDSYSGVLTKPVTPQQLNEAIAQTLSGQRLVTSQVTPPEDSNSLDKLRLLVVEDNDLNRQIAFELLAYEGAKVDLAEGGAEGVDKILNQGGCYDLIIMDVQMPDIDGLEAT